MVEISIRDVGCTYLQGTHFVKPRIRHLALRRNRPWLLLLLLLCVSLQISSSAASPLVQTPPRLLGWHQRQLLPEQAVTLRCQRLVPGQSGVCPPPSCQAPLGRYEIKIELKLLIVPSFYYETFSVVEARPRDAVDEWFEGFSWMCERDDEAKSGLGWAGLGSTHFSSCQIATRPSL